MNITITSTLKLHLLLSLLLLFVTIVIRIIIVKRTCYSDVGSDSQWCDTWVVITRPIHVGDRESVTVYGDQQGHANVQFSVRHWCGVGCVAGRLRVQPVRPTVQHDALRGLPVRRLGRIGDAHVRVDVVGWSDVAGCGRGCPMRHYTVVRRWNCRTPYERYTCRGEGRTYKSDYAKFIENDVRGLFKWYRDKCYYG